MATPTYVPLATVTLASADASITFSSIPATYRDLILVVAGTRTGNNNLLMRFNGDSGTNYSWVYARGNGSAGASGAETINIIPLAAEGLSTTEQLNGIAQIMDYSATDKHKTLLSRFNQAGTQTAMSANRWANTAAITSIEVFTGNNDFGIGTVLSIYGVN